MPTRNVSLTKELDQFIASKVEAGLYANASEVMRTALRVFERDERSTRRGWRHCEPPSTKDLPAESPNRGIFSNSQEIRTSG